jgi:hypothetical protein
MAPRVFKNIIFESCGYKCFIMNQILFVQLSRCTCNSLSSTSAFKTNVQLTYLQAQHHRVIHD